MNRIQIRAVTLPIVALAVFWCDSSFAQAPLEPGQMPSRTLFYLIWRGSPTGEARKANSFLALWDDPDLAPLRTAIFANAQSGSAEGAAKRQLTRDEMEQFATLLENPLVLGYLPEPEGKARRGASAKSSADRPWNGIFFVYNQTGKEALLAKAVLRLRSQEKDPPQVSPVTIGGMPVLKLERKTGVTYWGEHGKYAVSSGDLSVFEEIVARLDGKSASASSLAQITAYQEARPVCGGGLLEFFVRVPQLKDFASDTASAAFKSGPILDALKLDAIHSFCGRVTLEASKTRLQGAVLGDADPGTLFDLWSGGQQSPASLALVPSDAISYSETQISLAGIYDVAKRALRAALPPAQQSGADMMEGMAAGRIGMPVPEALNLVTGEFATIQVSPGMDPQAAVYFLGIRKKPETLKLIRSLFGDQLASERNVGDVTFLKVSLSGKQNTTGVAQWNFYHLAVTPTFILASNRIETVREFLARNSEKDPNARGGLPASVQTIRAQYPDALNGMGFLDFQKVDWQALKTRWIDETRKARAQRVTNGSRQDTIVSIPDWLEEMNPGVFPRHLHFLAGASWKDAKGIHFDEWLE